MGPNLEIPNDASWDVVPELCVEINSPTDTADDLEEKVKEYFDAGIQQVWVVYPRIPQIRVHLSRAESITLTAGDTLPGGEIIPGFELSLNELFTAKK
jgi:Uma2 family endonuclease